MCTRVVRFQLKIRGHCPAFIICLIQALFCLDAQVQLGLTAEVDARQENV